MDGSEATVGTPKVSRIAGAVVGCLLLAMLLVSAKLVDIAERQPLGDTRDWWVDVAEGVDRVSNFLGANRPYDLVTDIRGTGTDAGQRVDSIEEVAASLGTRREPFPTQVPVPTALVLPSPDSSATGAARRPETPEGVVTTPVPEETTGSQPTPGTENPAPAEGPTPAGSPTPGDSPTPVGSRPPDPTSDEELEPTESNAELLSAFEDVGQLPLPPPQVRPGLLPSSKIRTVTRDHPLRVYVAGDSQAFYPGHAMAAQVEGGLFDVTVDSRNGTGLARPDFFNWPAEFLEIVVEHDPELVVLFLGGNDWQAMQTADGMLLARGSDEWRSEWAWRMHIAFDTLVAPHRHVVWVGLPPARPEPFRTGYQMINESSWLVTLVRPDATMVDLWDLFGGDSPFQESVPPPTGGDPVRVRQEDGIHLNRTGSGWVAEKIVEIAAARWDFEESG